MALRLPGSLGEDRKARGGGLDPLERAVAAEKATSLGLAGRRLELALAALRGPGATRPREELVDEAAQLAWGFLIQRELCGLHDTDRVIADFGIPSEVVARIGAMGRQGR